MISAADLIRWLLKILRIFTKFRASRFTLYPPFLQNKRFGARAPHRACGKLALAGAAILMIGTPGASTAQEAQGGDALAAILAALGRTTAIDGAEVRQLLESAPASRSGRVISIDGAQPQSLEGADVKLLEQIGGLPEPIRAVDVRKGAHVLLVDSRNAVYLIDLRATKRSLQRLQPPYSDAEFARIREAYRDNRWYMYNGWDPPRSEDRALFMGLVLLDTSPSGTPMLADPPMPWIAVVPVDGAAEQSGDCSLYTVRNGGSAMLYSVCRSGAGFVRRELSQARLGRIRSNADSSLVAVETQTHILLLRAMNGSEVARISASGAGFNWIDPFHLLVYGNGDRASDKIVDGRSGAAMPLAQCGSTSVKLSPVTNVELGAGGAATVLLLGDDTIVEWDRGRRCVTRSG